MATAETTGERIERLRKARYMTQEALAESAGISRPQVTKLENDQVPNVRSSTLSAIAGALHVSLSELVEARDSSDAEVIPAATAQRDELIDFTAGLVEVALVAEVACGEPMDHSVEGETVIVRRDAAPDRSKGEYLIRARGDSMIEYGIHDGWYVVVESRVGGVAATGELIIAWYEPANGSAPGGITLKHWVRRSGRKILQGSRPENTFELQDGDVFELRGIVRRAFPPPIYFPRISG